MNREPNPFVLRLPPALKEALQAKAKENGRSLNAEILHRLQRSLEPRRRGYRVEEPTPDYVIEGETERAMLAVFRRLAAEKQLALLSLFK